MKTIVIPNEKIREAGAIIKKGGLVVFPTETVYGLGANAFNPVACARIFSAKSRPSDNPLIVHVASYQQLNEVVLEISPNAEKLIKAFWPGPLTLILPKKETIPDIVTAGWPTVAVRWPSNGLAQEFLLECGVPVAAPSANISGAPSPTNFEMAKAAMLGRVEGIIQGGDSEVGLESTILFFSPDNEVTILRPGSITEQMITEVLGCPCKNLADFGEGPVLAPGLKYTHYKPDAEVRLFSDISALLSYSQTADKVGVMLCEEYSGFLFPEHWEILRFNDWETYARYLYASFHELDQIGCTLILAQLPPQEGICLAIGNRLQKASGSFMLSSR